MISGSAQALETLKQEMAAENRQFEDLNRQLKTAKAELVRQQAGVKTKEAEVKQLSDQIAMVEREMAKQQDALRHLQLELKRVANQAA